MNHTGARTYNTCDEWPCGGIKAVPYNPIPALAGWNYFGGYDYTVPAGGVTTTPPDLITGPIYKYNNGYVIANELVPGYGYAVNLTGAGQINIPPRSFEAKIPNHSIANITSADYTNGGKIIITDSDSKSFTLYNISIDDKDDLNKYNLPPVPPEGLFDVRFSSQRFVEDLSIGNQTIDLNGVQYPVTVLVENMKIKLQDVSAKVLNTELTSGEKVVVHQNAITKFIITLIEAAPVNYVLEQNYPNPFNPSTSIKYQIPELSIVTLKVYDVLGNEIAILINEEKLPGNYELKFDATKLASGVYFYQLKAGSFTDIKKMILIR
jgi:hypothetical protein